MEWLIAIIDTCINPQIYYDLVNDQGMYAIIDISGSCARQYSLTRSPNGKNTWI